MLASGPGNAVAGGRADETTVCRCDIAETDTQIYLRDLMYSSSNIATISDAVIRTTREFQSYMHGYNRWQWKDRITETEALYACRLMLADMHAGQRIRWQADARRYVMRARNSLAYISAAEKRDLTGVAGTLTPRNRDRSNAPSSAPGDRTGESDKQTGSRPDDWAPTPQLPSGPESIPSARPSASPTIPAHARPGRPSSVVDILDDGWRWLSLLKRGGDHTAAHLLETLLDTTEQQLAAATVFLAGTTVTIILAKGTAEFTLVIEGVKAADIALMVDIAEPLMLNLGANLGKIQTLSNTVGLLPAIAHPILAVTSGERTYRALARRPADAMTQAQLEQLQTLRQRYEPTRTLVPTTAIHKAQRWADYQARSGDWTFERWSQGYENSVRQYQRGNAIADRYHQTLGWGQREVPVTLNGKTRVLDIADLEQFIGVEVKSGYVSHRRSIATQVRFDTNLVRRGWTITWYVEGRFSDPLRRVLLRAGIKIIETNPLLRS